MSSPIKVYYHIADLFGWQELVDEKIELMKKSNLWETAKEIHLLLHYNEATFESWVKQFQNDSRIKIVNFQHSCRPLGENYSNRYIWNDCWNTKYEFNLLRYHTKGLYQRTFPHWPVAVKWNEYYDYFNIERWADCNKSLDEGYDVAGANWYYPGHFSGNIWWAKSHYVKSLPLLTAPHLINSIKQIDVSLTVRHDAELWIGLKSAKVKEFHHHNYYCVYDVPPPENYRY